MRYSSPSEAGDETRPGPAGLGFAEHALSTSSGDCDVQNGLVTVLLQAAGIPARLAIGYVGHQGRVAAWLHAWVEYRDESGQLRVADASNGAPPLAEGRAEPLSPGAGRATAPPPQAAAAQTRPGDGPGSWSPSTGVLISALAGLSLVVITLLARTRRAVHLDPQPDIAGLLTGALRHPEAFQDVPAVFHRRLIPLVGGRMASLAELWKLASRGRLLGARAASSLTAKALRAGLKVVDTSSPEGLAVVEALGAEDLDAWWLRLGSGHTTKLLETVESALQRRGEPVRLRVGGPLTEPAILDLRTEGLRGGGDQWLLLGEGVPWYREAQALWGHRPAEAVFRAADRVSDLLELRWEGRCRVLSPLAREAVLEARNP